MPRAAAETNPLVIMDGGSFDVAHAQRPVSHAMPSSAWSLQRIGQRLARRAKLGSGDAEHEEWEMYYQTNDEVSDGLTWSQVIAHTCAARSALLHLTRKGPSSGKHPTSPAQQNSQATLCVARTQGTRRGEGGADRGGHAGVVQLA